MYVVRINKLYLWAVIIPAVRIPYSLAIDSAVPKPCEDDNGALANSGLATPAHYDEEEITQVNAETIQNISITFNTIINYNGQNRDFLLDTSSPKVACTIKT